ncbi:MULTISPECIES: hypothetical protein [unclassified Methanosarcina]|nr:MULTISPECIES: hypothetical protein [unclassified Methanosarcina]
MIQSDEPVALGGGATAPNPVQYEEIDNSLKSQSSVVHVITV